MSTMHGKNVSHYKEYKINPQQEKEIKTQHELLKRFSQKIEKDSIEPFNNNVLIKVTSPKTKVLDVGGSNEIVDIEIWKLSAHVKATKPFLKEGVKVYAPLVTGLISKVFLEEDEDNVYDYCSISAEQLIYGYKLKPVVEAIKEEPIEVPVEAPIAG